MIDQDKQNELTFAGWLSDKGYRVQPLRKYSAYDFLIYNQDQPRAFVEYKKRNHSYGHYPTEYFPFHKFISCKSISFFSGLPGYIYYEWTDSLGWCNIIGMTYELTFAGRKDRGRDESMLMLEIPVTNFCVTT